MVVVFYPIGSDNLVELVNKLDNVTSQWFSLGVQLKVPYKNLKVISSDHRGDARRCMVEMIQCWLKNSLDAKWSTIILALAKIGEKDLAHKIAINHGMHYICVKMIREQEETLRE